MQQTPGFISSLVIDRITSLLRHDSSEELPPLDWMWGKKTLVETSNFQLSLL